VRKRGTTEEERVTERELQDAAPAVAAAAGALPQAAAAAATRSEGATRLPVVSGEVVAAVLLVDLDTMDVVHAGGTTTHVNDARLPMPLREWSDRAGLTTLDGTSLGGTGTDLEAVARGEAPRGVMVQRREPGPTAADPQDATGDPEADRLQGIADRASDSMQRAQVLWVTGVPLAPAEPGAPAEASTRPDLVNRALLVLLEVSAASTDATDTARMHNRAVVATDLSFTISDPLAQDDPLVWVNPAFERTTGYRASEVLGRNCRFLQGPDTDREAVDRIRAALRAAEPVRETLLNYRADGSPFWNQVSISPVLDGDGNLVNFVGVQSDVTARVDAEHARELALASERRARARLALLADVGDAVTQMDPQHALRRLTEVITKGSATWCVALEVDDEVRVVAASGVSPSRLGRFRLPAAGNGPDPLADLATGRSRDRFERDADAPPPATGTLTAWMQAQLDADEATGPWVALATPGRREVRGMLVLGVPHLPMDREESDLLFQVARRTGLSLDNAWLYAREHLVAETLQRSMLPEVVDVPGLDLWSFYAPGVEHAQVGGDWYDVLRVDEDTVGLVIGDVVGHDIEAASAMGQLRSVVRAYSADGDDPGAVLMRVDQLVGGMRITRSASLVYATLSRLGESTWEMSWSRAGHLPPIVVRDGRAEALMDGGGPMIGMSAEARGHEERDLGPGDVLVLYTDGLIERRSRPLRAGLQRLLEVCEELDVSDAAGIGERLLAELGEQPEDDIAIVVLRVPVPGEPVGPRTGHRSRRWQLPGETSSIPRARELVRQSCRMWELPQSRHAELVVSELVANGVLHGRGTVGLHLREDEARTLRIEVADANPSPPRQVDGHPDTTGGFGLTVVSRVARWGWRAERGGKVVWAVVPAGDDEREG
jgi:PAS domain S-box-containing protein